MLKGCGGRGGGEGAGGGREGMLIGVCGAEEAGREGGRRRRGICWQGYGGHVGSMEHERAHAMCGWSHGQ